MPLVATGPCWVCGGTVQERVWSDPFDLSEFARFGAYAHANHPPTWLVRCRACGFGQPESLPALPDFFDTLYTMDWSPESLDREFDSGYKDEIFRVVLAGLERRLSAGLPKTVLDVGTHVGRFVLLARQAGWDAEGLEFNPLTASYAARRTGATIHQGLAQDLAAAGRRYSALTLNDVLEHIPQPVPLLADLRSLLYPGGIVAVKVPNGPMQRFKERIRRSVLRSASAGVMTRYVHVNHFTVKSLRHCLEGAGFRGVTIAVAAPDFMPASFPGRTRGQALSALLRMSVYRAAGLCPWSVHTPLALNLQAFAINPA
jgi:2-polyprenyl-3-methyl-5-hydroxy-6-metoxy-1,4-benzoquinol methylase